MALLWHRLQILLHLSELLLPFRRLSTRPALLVDALNRSVERELRRLEIPAARRDVRVIEEQLNGVEIDTALQESAASFAPEIVHVQIQFRELLAAAGKESAGRSPVRAVPNCAQSQRGPRLLVVLQTLPDLVAERTRRVRIPRYPDRAVVGRASRGAPATTERTAFAGPW